MIIKRSYPANLSFLLAVYLTALHTFALEAGTKIIEEADNVPNLSSYEPPPISPQTQEYQSLDAVNNGQSFNHSPKKRKRYSTPKRMIPLLSIIVSATTYSVWHSEDNELLITEDKPLQKVPKSEKETLAEDIQERTEDNVQKPNFSHEEDEEESEKEQTPPPYRLKIHQYNPSYVSSASSMQIGYPNLNNQRQKSATLSPHYESNITKQNLANFNQVHFPKDTSLSVGPEHQGSLQRNYSNPYLMHASAPTYLSLKPSSENGSISEIPLKQEDSPVNDEDIVISYENDKPVVQLQKDIRQKNEHSPIHQRRPTPKIKPKKSLKNKFKDSKQELVRKIGNKISEVKENYKQKKQKEKEEKEGLAYEKINEKDTEYLNNEIPLV